MHVYFLVPPQVASGLGAARATPARKSNTWKRILNEGQAEAKVKIVIAVLYVEREQQQHGGGTSAGQQNKYWREKGMRRFTCFQIEHRTVWMTARPWLAIISTIGQRGGLTGEARRSSVRSSGGGNHNARDDHAAMPLAKTR